VKHTAHATRDFNTLTQKLEIGTVPIRDYQLIIISNNLRVLTMLQLLSTVSASVDKGHVHII